MPRLERELLHTISRIWTPNIGDCHGGKFSGKMMRICALFPVQNIIFHMFQGFQLSDSGERFAFWLTFLVKIYQDPIFVTKLDLHNVFSNRASVCLLTALTLLSSATFDSW